MVKYKFKTSKGESKNHEIRFTISKEESERIDKALKELIKISPLFVGRKNDIIFIGVMDYVDRILTQVSSFKLDVARREMIIPLVKTKMKGGEN